MPSASELRQMGRNDLAVYIGRNGGFKFWSNEMGVNMKNSETLFGWSGEAFVKEKLEEIGYIAEKCLTRCHYDLLVDSILRIDVKCANYAEYGPSQGWFYRLGKEITADIVICARMDLRDYYVFPWNHVPSTNLTISKTGKKHTNYYMANHIIQSMLEVRKLEKNRLSELIHK